MIYYSKTISTLFLLYRKMSDFREELNSNQETREDCPTPQYMSLINQTFYKYKKRYEELYLLLYQHIPSCICHDNKQIIMTYLL